MSGRAVITGRGVYSALGCDWLAFARAVREGRAPAPGRFPGALPGFDACLLLAEPGLPPEALAREEPLGVLATAAVRQALDDAGIACEGAPLDGVGLVMNTVFGPSTAVEAYLERLRERGPRAARPAQFVDTLLSMPASKAGIALGLRGSTAVLGGSSALDLAFDWIRHSRAGAVVAGGADYHSPKCLRYEVLLAERSGAERAVPGQGAGFVVLEPAAHAQERGARVHGELLGAGGASEPQDVSLPWSDAPDALAAAMREALAGAAVAPDAIDAVALISGDDAFERAELAALRAVLGDHADPVALLRPKRLLGETLGASAPLGLLAALAALERGGTALVNGFEMGGAASSLVVRVAP